MSGFSKSKVNAVVSGLIDRGMLEEGGHLTSTGGRRPEFLRLSHRLGILAAIDIGATSVDVALLNPDMSIVAHRCEPADVSTGPQLILRVLAILRELLAVHGLTPDQVWGIGMGVPGPVAFTSGQLVNPPLMPGWEGVPIRDFFAKEYDAPVFVDNDVNLMALATLWKMQGELENFLVVKIGTGIGCGIICHGMVYRGTDGAAGDIGHISADPAGPLCHCGNVGCIEAMAAGPAITCLAEEAARSGKSPRLKDILDTNGLLTPVDIGNASRTGDIAANAIVQHAGVLIGNVLAAIVNFYNPSHIFIGGGVAQIGPLFLASIRQSVYRRSLALSTRNLELQYLPDAHLAGIIGAAVLAVQETMFSRAS